MDSNRFALHAKRLYDGGRGTYIDDAIVAIEGDTIAGVFASFEDFVRHYPDVEVEELGESYMTPGLIDSHVHMISPPGCGVTVRNPFEEFDTGELTLFAAQNCETALKRGVTTMRDCGCRLDVALSLKRMIARGSLNGPDLLICGAPLTSTGGHGAEYGGEVDGEDNIRHAVRRQVKAGCDFVKLMATGGGGNGAGHLNYTLGEIRAATEEGHRQGLKVSAHVCSTEGARRMLDTGVDSFEHCLLTSGDGVDYDPAIPEGMQARGIVIGHTLQVLLTPLRMLKQMKPTSAVRKEMDRFARLHEATMLVNTKLVRDGGVYIAGSDAGWRACAFGELWEGMDLLCQCGATTAESMYTATGRAADFHGVGDRLGYIKKGSQADLLILAVDPLISIRAFQRVQRVYKKGRRV